MARRAAPLLLLALALAASGCARLLYNFGTVEAGHIYRGAQPSPLFLRWIVHRHGVRTLVNLRGDTPGFESAFAARRGLRLYSFSLSANSLPTAQEVQDFLRILRDPENHPVLVHCRSGVDRTGYMLGLYRVAVQGWRPARAAREMNRYLQFEWVNANPQRVVRRAAEGP